MRQSIQARSLPLTEIRPGSFLTLHYRLAGADGTDIVNTFDDKPATLSLGTGELAPAMESRLIGLPEGAHARFELASGEAFGERNAELLQRVAMSVLREHGEPGRAYAVGDVVQFPTPDGQRLVRRRRARGRRRLAAVRFQSSARRTAGDFRSASDRSAVMTAPQLEEIVLAEPRGFCAGVDRAIEIVERALAKFGAPIYVRHEIVHNTYVVNDLKAKGAIFIEDLSEVPSGATLVFSAHGVSQAVRREAAERGFSVFDATCPLVTKVHVEVAKLHKEGYEFIMIGHKGHPEVEGTMGQLSEGIYLVEDVDDVERVQVGNPSGSRW